MLVNKKNPSRLIVTVSCLLTVVFVSLLISNTYLQNNRPDLVIHTDKNIYEIGDTVNISISYSNKNDSGLLVVLDPGQEIHSKLYFSGISGIPNHRLHLSPYYASECNCDMRGTWQIRYDVVDGYQYPPIFFMVQ